MEKYKFNYWFEWGCSDNFCPCLWSANSFAKDKYGYCVDLHKLPISENLIDFLCKLGIEHDDALDGDYPPNPLLWTDEQEKDFYLKAEEGYKRLQEELGDEYIINYCEKIVD